MKKSQKTYKLSLSAMTVALSVLFLYGSELIPYMRFPLCFLACFCLQVLLSERLVGRAWLCFLGVSVLSFFLLTDRFSWFAWVALLGHYPMVRGAVHRFVRAGWAQSLCLAIYCNLSLAVFGVVFMLLFDVPIAGLLPNLPIILLVAIAEILIFGLDILYRACVGFYESRVRPLLRQ
ncbi:MAG: hypothetical protein FWE69_04785 [Clostridiales bacterium]|nr:hypothetical protein [Clostridiales bacterium]